MKDEQEVIANREIEEALLGAILINPDMYYEVDGHVDKRDFYIHRHRWIWEAIQNITEEGGALDFTTLIDELEKINRLEDIGGAAYLTKVTNNVPSSLHGVDYAERVADLSVRRRVLEYANDMAQAAYQPELSLGDMADRFYSLSTNRGKNAEHWSDEWIQFKVDLQRRYEEKPGDVWGLSYGTQFTRLNKATGGAHNSQFAILGGMPGIGKSVLSKDWTLEWVKQAPGALYSLEMPSVVWMRRAISGRVGVPTQAMMAGEISQVELDRINGEVDDVLTGNLFLSDHEDWTTDEIRADLTRLKRQHGIEWVVIDYLQQCSDVAEDDVEASKKIAERLRKTCRALDIHVLALSAVNKAGMTGGVPTMGNLSGSGKVLHEADVVFWLNEFTPLGDEGAVWDELSSNEKFDIMRSMRTLFILKGRHLPNPNMAKHMAFGKDVPKIAESEFDMAFIQDAPVGEGRYWDD